MRMGRLIIVEDGVDDVIDVGFEVEVLKLYMYVGVEGDDVCRWLMSVENVVEEEDEDEDEDEVPKPDFPNNNDVGG